MGFLADDKQHYICTPNPEIVMEAQHDKELMKILREADLVVPDGIGVVWASRYSEILLTERVAGYDLTQNIFSRIAGKNESVYFFGGAPGVASTAARQMKKVYPGLKIVGGHNGYFDAEEEKKIIADIKTSFSVHTIGRTGRTQTGKMDLRTSGRSGCKGCHWRWRQF